MTKSILMKFLHVFLLYLPVTSGFIFWFVASPEFLSLGEIIIILYVMLIFNHQIKPLFEKYDKEKQKEESS